MGKIDRVTKTEYADGNLGYCFRIAKEKVRHLGWLNANHQVLKAIAICLRAVNEDHRLISKLYVHCLNDGDVTVNVVCDGYSELDSLKKQKGQVVNTVN